MHADYLHTLAECHRGLPSADEWFRKYPISAESSHLFTRLCSAYCSPWEASGGRSAIRIEMKNWLESLFLVRFCLMKSGIVLRGGRRDERGWPLKENLTVGYWKEKTSIIVSIGVAVYTFTANEARILPLIMSLHALYTQYPDLTPKTT